MKPDLETLIHQAWQTSQDIDLLFSWYLDCPNPMTEDEVANTVLGIKMLHDLRMEKLFDGYKQIFELDEYCTDSEKLEFREKIYERIDKKLKPKKKGKK